MKAKFPYLGVGREGGQMEAQPTSGDIQDAESWQRAKSFIDSPVVILLPSQSELAQIVSTGNGSRVGRSELFGHNDKRV